MDKQAICKVKHPQWGEVEVFEAEGKGCRVYYRGGDGMVPCQDRASQQKIRGLVIAAGHGGKLGKPPTLLEIANFAPEKPETETVSVSDNVPEDSGAVVIPPGESATVEISVNPPVEPEDTARFKIERGI